MSTMSLSRRQRRQMKRLGDEANRAVEGNRRFFDRWPGRTYRTRLASSAERQQLEIVQSAMETTVPSVAPPIEMAREVGSCRTKPEVPFCRSVTLLLIA